MNSTDIRLLILQQSPLDTLVALAQTCRDWRFVLERYSGSVVREKVLERVPWMTLAPEVGMTSWMDCARLIVARKRSYLEQPDDWWQYNDTQRGMNPNLQQLVRNTDIEYLSAERIEGRVLPADFEPLIDSELTHVQDKFFLSPRGKVLDMTTIKLVQEPIERRRKKYSRFYAMPVSKQDGIWTLKGSNSSLVIESKTEFHLEQERNWLVLTALEARKTYIVTDPEPFKHSDVFVFDPQDSSSCLHVPHYSSSYILALVPGAQGVVAIENVGANQVIVQYLDLASSGSQSTYSWWFETPNRETVTTVNFYAGMMFLNVNCSVLVPLWVDLDPESDTSHRFLGNKYMWKSVLYRHGPHIHFTYMDQRFDMIRSGDRRWATGRSGRQVGDLWTFKSFVVKDRTDGCAPCTHDHHIAPTLFVGKGKGAETKPCFYTVTKWVMETLDSFLYGTRFQRNGFPGGRANKDPTKFWIKVMEETIRDPYNAFDLFGDGRRPVVDDQRIVSEWLEDPIGLSCLDGW
ncbi:hypothetical protein CKK34_2447 [Yarrowia sp. E02]|nr:hypothetical protein CKK34_2447 [Yarrowia sp. E02]